MSFLFYHTHKTVSVNNLTLNHYFIIILLLVHIQHVAEFVELKDKEAGSETLISLEQYLSNFQKPANE